jgi:hypothetical protein
LSSLTRKADFTTTQLRAYLERALKPVTINGETQVPKFPTSDEIVLVEGLVPKAGCRDFEAFGTGKQHCSAGCITTLHVTHLDSEPQLG